jgi:hypothetical protein
VAHTKSNEEGEEKLFESNNLKPTRTDVDVFNEERLTSLLRRMTFNFGCYYFDMHVINLGGHAIGFKTGGTGFYIFDPNIGLYRLANPDDFVNGNARFLLKEYSMFVGGGIRCYLCQLEGK